GVLPGQQSHSHPRTPCLSGRCSHGHSDGARGEEEDTRGTPVRHGSAVRLCGTAVRHTRGTPVPYTRDSQRHTRAVLGRVAAGYEWAPRVPLRGGAVQGPVGGPVGGRVKGRVGGRSGRLSGSCGGSPSG